MLSVCLIHSGPVDSLSKVVDGCTTHTVQAVLGVDSKD